MKFYISVFTIIFVFSNLVEGYHRILGTSVERQMVQHFEASYGSKWLQKRIEYFDYSLPATPANFGHAIQGILAYDLENSSATANVTEGGIGFNFVKLRMKSERGKPLHYDIYIYA